MAVLFRKFHSEEFTSLERSRRNLNDIKHNVLNEEQWQMLNDRRVMTVLSNAVHVRLFQCVFRYVKLNFIY